MKNDDNPKTVRIAAGSSIFLNRNLHVFSLKRKYLKVDILKICLEGLTDSYKDK